jgi:hypothetical protein
VSRTAHRPARRALNQRPKALPHRLVPCQHPPPGRFRAAPGPGGWRRGYGGPQVPWRCEDHLPCYEDSSWLQLVTAVVHDVFKQQRRSTFAVVVVIEEVEVVSRTWFVETGPAQYSPATPPRCSPAPRCSHIKVGCSASNSEEPPPSFLFAPLFYLLLPPPTPPLVVSWLVKRPAVSGGREALTTSRRQRLAGKAVCYGAEKLF